MDIRNFFGGKKKASSSAPAASSVATKKKPPPATATSKSNDKTQPTKAPESASKPKKTTDEEPKSKKALSMEDRRKKLLESSDDDSDREVTKPAVAAKKKVEPSPAKTSPRKTTSKMREESPTRLSPRKRKVAAPEYSDSKSSRRKIADSDDSDDEEFVEKTGKDDDDFSGDEEMANESEDEDEYLDDPKPKSKKRVSVESPGRSPPPKRATASDKPKPKPKKAKVEEVVIPKYHPPSSKLLSKIPFLENDESITIQTNVPKLPMKEGKSLADSFSVDDMTPLCLEGLTIVFSGILTTNAAKTAATNAAVALSSPTKGEYYQNRNAYTTSTMAGIGSDEELSRDLASDIVKMLGGRVTTGVSGKTDYLVLGSILEDGRPVEDGSKHKKVLEIYDTWSAKHRGDCNGGGKAKGKTAKKTKAQDPNSLVEIIRGVDEFYGLIKFMSEWKKGTLPEEERAKLEASQTTAKKEAAPPPAPAAATSAPVTVPYSKATVTNPYAKTVPVNPYSKSKSTPVNPYNKSALPTNPYAKKAADTSPSTDTQPIETKPAVFQINALWADKYAPSNSREILGNSDSVNKLSNWLHNWEATFNDPKKKQKGLSGPNGPWKAALLSGPPGIGKTTTATLVAKELNRDVIELNASDARSKKALTEALGDLSGTHALNFANAGSSKSAKTAPRKRCIIMDEVDGMGAGDRSGISELIQMIKKSKVPIICICNDRSSQKMKSLVQYCMDLRYRRPTKNVIARRAVEVGRLEGMVVEHNAAEALSESCGNDIRQVLNCLQMWSSKKPDNNASTSLTFKELRERQNDINKDEVLRVSMFDATKLIVEGSRGLEHADNKTATTSLLKRSDAYFVDYMLMGLNVHQNYLKVALGQFNQAKLKGDEEIEQKALEELHNATLAMSDFGVCEEQLRGADQNWSLLPLCSMLAVKVGHHAGGPNGGFLPGYPEFAGWLGKNSSRNKRIRLLQELRHHMNYRVSADGPELRMNYLPVMRQQFQELLFHKDGANVTEAIELMDEYGIDRDDLFENLDEFVLAITGEKEKKFGDLDSKAKAAFTRAYNQVAHKSEALVAEQGIGKSGRRKSTSGASEMGETGELDVVDDDKAAAAQDDDEQDDEEDVEALIEMFMKKKKKAATTASKSKGTKGGTSSKGKKK